MFAYIGVYVIGSHIALKLNLKIGDTLSSSPTNYFDFARTYSLNMLVTEILKENYSPDDQALFVGIKTHWVLMGIGHGHTELAKLNDPSLFLSKKNNVANAKLKLNNQVNVCTREEFHFHGDMNSFPIS